MVRMTNYTAFCAPAGAALLDAASVAPLHASCASLSTAMALQYGPSPAGCRRHCDAVLVSSACSSCSAEDLRRIRADWRSRNRDPMCQT